VIDAYASQSHYWDHIAPIWQHLLPSERGTLYVSPAVAPYVTIPHSTVRLPPAARHPVIVAGAPDLPKVGKRPVVFVEHGTGQTYSVGIPAEACYLFDAKEQAFPRTAKYIRT
jgi:hypothetical protein